MPGDPLGILSKTAPVENNDPLGILKKKATGVPSTTGVQQPVVNSNSSQSQSISTSPSVGVFSVEDIENAKNKFNNQGVDNTVVAHPQIISNEAPAAAAATAVQNKVIRKQQVNQAIHNTAVAKMKSQGLDPDKDKDGLQFQENFYRDKVDNGDAGLTFGTYGELGLQRKVGFVEALTTSHANAIQSADDADQFINNMTPEQQVEYANKQGQDNQYPEYKSTSNTTGGSLGNMLGSNAPFLEKAVAGTVTGSALIAAAPESLGASLAGLPTALSFAFTSKDAVNQASMNEVLRRYQILKKQNPKLSYVEAMKEAGNGKWAGGAEGLLTNAALTGGELPNEGGGLLDKPISPSATSAIESNVKNFAKEPLKMGAISAGGTAATELEGNAEGVKTSGGQILKDAGNSGLQALSVGAVLHTLTAATMGLMGKVSPPLLNSLKYGLVNSDVPISDIHSTLEANEKLGNIPEGSADHIATDLTDYKDALGKVPPDLPDDKKAITAGLVKEKKPIIEEQKQTDPAFKDYYKGKTDAIDGQIKSVVATPSTEDATLLDQDGNTLLSGESPVTRKTSDAQPSKTIIQPEKTFRTLDYGEHKGEPESTEAQTQIKQDILDDKPLGGTGDKFSDFTKRIIPAFQDILNKEDNNTTLVTHSSVIKALDVWEDMGRPDIEKMTNEQKQDFAKKYVAESPAKEGDVTTFKADNGNEIHVVRHGETEDNKMSEFRDDTTQLTPKGEKQASQAGQQLKDITGGDVPKIVHSDLIRAQQTTDIINGELNKENENTTKNNSENKQGEQPAEETQQPDKGINKNTQSTETAHAEDIKSKFKEAFKAKDVPEDHIDAAIALMDTRARIWSKEKPGRTPERWYQQIKDVKNGEFENSDIKYQGGKLKAAIVGATALLHPLEAADKGIDADIPDNKPKTEEISDSKKIKIIDPREVDAVSKKSVTDKNKLSHTAYAGDIKTIVRYANKEGIDPYTALAMAYQETGLAPFDETESNPFHMRYDESFKDAGDNLDSVVANSMKIIKDKFEHGKKLGKTNDADIIQAFNGYGKVGKDTEGRNKSMYGIDVTHHDIDMNKTPLYGERIVDIRDNILKKNPEIVKIVDGEKNNVAFQEEEGSRKGAVETLNDGRVIIHALDAPDFSTLAHEIAHVFEKDLTGKEKKIVDDFGGSEPFARGFEKYLRDGKAPSEEMKPLFEKFKDWLTSIYQQLKGSPIEKKITPEIKQIFDRLLSEKEQSEKPQGLMKQAAGLEDLTDPRDIVLQHFAAGGKIHTDAINDLFGGKDERIRQNASTESERKARFSLLSPNAEGIDGLAHQLWEGQSKEMQDVHSTQDFKEAVENVLQDHNSPASMARELIGKYGDNGKKEQEWYANKYPEASDDDIKEFNNHISDDDLQKMFDDAKKEEHEYYNQLTEDKRKADGVQEHPTSAEQTSKGQPKKDKAGNVLEDTGLQKPVDTGRTGIDDTGRGESETSEPHISSGTGDEQPIKSASDIKKENEKINFARTNSFRYFKEKYPDSGITEYNELRSKKVAQAMVGDVAGVVPFINRDIAPNLLKFKDNASKWIKSVGEAIKKWYDLDDPAKLTKTILRPFLADTAEKKDAAWNVVKERRRMWDKVSDEEKMDFINSIESGKYSPQDFIKAGADENKANMYSAVAKEYRERLDAMHALEKTYKEQAQYIDNYFPHIWDKPNKAQDFFSSYTSKMSKQGFEKARTIDLIKAGLDKGLKLKTTNPEEIVLMREFGGIQRKSMVDFMNKMKDEGLVKMAFTNKETDKLVIPDGFKQLKDDYFNKMKIYGDLTPVNKGKESTIFGEKNKVDMQSGTPVFAAGAEKVIENYLSPSLMSKEGFSGKLFRGSMSVKNFATSIQLLSGFHLVMTTISDIATHLNIAGRNLQRGEFGKFAVNLLKSPISPIIDFTKQLGKDDIKNAWLNGTNDPELQASIDLIKRGGGRPTLSEIWTKGLDGQWASAVDEYKKGNNIGGTLRLIPAAMEGVQKLMLDGYVSRIKLNSYLKLASDYMTHTDETDEVKQNQQLGKMWDSIDNRFGQLVYDNLFWKRWVRDMGTASTLSLGWNLGTIREFGGAASDLPNDIINSLKNKKPQLSDRVMFAITYPLLVGAIGGLMTKLLTGKNPKDLIDYFYPVSERAEDGTATERIQIPSMMKEYFGLKNTLQSKGVIAGTGTYITNKLAPQFSTTVNMMTNKDYYNQEIYNPNAPLHEQAKQIAEYLAEQLEPISYSSIKKSGHTGSKMLLDIMGLTKAPAYISNTPMENNIMNLFSERNAGTKPYSAKEEKDIKTTIKQLAAAGDKTKLDAYAKDVIENGKLSASQVRGVLKSTNSSSSPAEYMFTRLPNSDKVELYRGMSDEEKKQYDPKGKIKALVEKIDKSRTTEEENLK